MNKLAICALTLFTLLPLSHTSLADTTLNNNSVVIDKNRTVIRALLNGTCVRTKWENGRDVCAPVATNTTIVTTRTVLTDDERSVYFEFNRADLTPLARDNLDHVTRRLTQADDVARVEIVGFADRIGSSAYNDRLSARRATAVKDYLVRQGYVNVDVANLRAMGESQPRTNCDIGGNRSNEIKCLSPDRRVDIQLTYTDQVRTTSSR